MELVISRILWLEKPEIGHFSEAIQAPAPNSWTLCKPSPESSSLTTKKF